MATTATAIKTTSTADLALLVEPINRHHRELKQLLLRSLDHAHEAGLLLLQAKAAVPHGQFGAWINVNCEFSDRTARSYMAIAENWAVIQSNQQQFDKLSVRGAVRLLAEEATPADQNGSASVVDIHAAYPGELPPHPPEEWEALPGQIRVGFCPDHRIIVQEGLPSSIYVRFLVMDADRSGFNYQKRGVNRHYFRWILAISENIDPSEVEWNEPKPWRADNNPFAEWIPEWRYSAAESC